MPSDEKLTEPLYKKELFNLTDQKIVDTLSNLYLHKFKGKSPDSNNFLSLTMDVYDYLIENKTPNELICKVMLRIIISVKKMTGGGEHSQKVGMYFS